VWYKTGGESRYGRQALRCVQQRQSVDGSRLSACVESWRRNHSTGGGCRGESPITLANEAALRRALEAAGIDFIEGRRRRGRRSLSQAARTEDAGNMTATSALASLGCEYEPAQEAMLNCCSPSTFRSICLPSSGPLGSAGARIERCSFAYIIQLRVDLLFRCHPPRVSSKCSL
jgi:hypothetical protein